MSAEIHHRIAARLRSLRTAKGWSQERLAEEAGLHRTYIGAIERAERNISLKCLQRLAQALSVPVTDLIRGE